MSREVLSAGHSPFIRNKSGECIVHESCQTAVRVTKCWDLSLRCFNIDFLDFFTLKGNLPTPKRESENALDEPAQVNT